MSSIEDTDPRLPELLDAALEGSPEVTEPLRRDAKLRRTLEAAEQALAVVDALPREPSPELRPRLWARLEAEDARPRRWGFLPRLSPWALAGGGLAAAAALALVLTFPAQGPEGHDSPEALALRLEQLEIARDQELYENLEILEHLDVLDDLAVIEALPEERG